MSPTPKGKSYETRLRFGRTPEGKEARKRFVIAIDPQAPDAAARAEEAERVMQVMAAQLSQLGDTEKALETLTEAGKVASDPKKLRALALAVELACRNAAGKVRTEDEPGLTTFRDVAEAWCSGQLTELYPDHKLLPSKTDKGRANDLTIVRTFYPAIGGMRLADVTLADIDAARRLIPKDLHPNTRRRFVVELRLIFRLAVSPLRILSAVPEIDIPRRVPSNLFGYLYPQEEAALLSCWKVPLVYRVLYGYLARNGCRIGETLQVTWDHIDLETGDIHIDKRWTKTKRARRWVLDTDVRQALEAWHVASGRPAGSARVFPGRQKARLVGATVNKRFISDLRKAGVTRPSILEGADGIEPIRVHDLRASFVTLSLRAGKPLKWIMTRTGHESLGVMKGYDRLVQDAEEHHLPAWFSHMGRAIPELARHLEGGPSPGQSLKNTDEKAHFARSAWTAEPGSDEQKPAEKPTSVTTETPPDPTSGPAEFQGVGQAGPAPSNPASPAGSDPVAAALAEVEVLLARSLDRATADREWATARVLAAELEARRLSREAQAAKAKGVTSLDAARKRRDGDK